MPDIADDIVNAAKADPPALDRVETLFDEAAHEQRVAAIRQFGRTLQRKLYDAAEGRGVDLDQLVEPETPPMTEVIHEGQNTLPVFRAFQKRFCRPAPDTQTDDRDLLWGYNEQTFRAVTGPGYFVAYEDERTGEVCIDYREIPAAAPDGWPEIQPNEARLGRFVYAGTVDRLRRLSDHVTIGRAFIDDEDPMNAWFVLVRQA